MYIRIMYNFRRDERRIREEIYLFFYFLIEDEWITAAFSLKIAIFLSRLFWEKKQKIAMLWAAN